VAGTSASLRIVAGSNAGRTLRLQKLVTVIGSGKTADLVIEGDKVSENHASIEAGADGTYVLRNRSSFGTLVDRVRVDVHELADGNRIQIGAAALVEFKAGPPAKAAGAAGGKKKTTMYVLGGFYLVAMIGLAVFLQGISNSDSHGISGTAIAETLDDTRSLFDPARKDVARPSQPVVIDDSDLTAPYYRIVNAQLRGEDAAAVKVRVDEFIGVLRADLQEASALERQERWKEADARYRELMQRVPDPRAQIARLAAGRIASLAEKLPHED
jgi:Inner membrane component of T3SS, cytoplasmic domain